MINYQVGDFLTQIKNAALVKRHEVITQATKFKLAVAKALQKSGFVEDFSVKDNLLLLRIKFSHKEPILLNIKLVSKPGRRIYLTAGDLREKKGPSIFLISTPKGVLISKEAIKLGIGGEIIAEVW